MSWSAKVLLVNVGLHLGGFVLIWILEGMSAGEEAVLVVLMLIVLITAVQIVLNVIIGFWALNARDAAYAQPFFLSALVLPLIGFSICSLSL